MLFPKPKKKVKAKKYLKRTPLNKVGKSSYKRAKKQANEAFSRFIRLRDAIKTTGGRDEAKCYTCPAIVKIWGRGCIQAGHFIPGRMNIVLFDERQVHAQCYVCNIVKSGNWPVYLTNMRLDYGEEAVQIMIDSRIDEVKLTTVDFEAIRDLYIDKFSKL